MPAGWGMMALLVGDNSETVTQFFGLIRPIPSGTPLLLENRRSLFAERGNCESLTGRQSNGGRDCQPVRHSPPPWELKVAVCGARELRIADRKAKQWRERLSTRQALPSLGGAGEAAGTCSLGLHVVQLLVIPVLVDEALVGTTLHDTALVEHAYLVGVLDGRQAMGDSHGGACLH